MKKTPLFFLFLLFFLFSNITSAQLSPKYEFRAVWVATVENIDWPSQKGLSTAQQKQEFIDLLNTQQRNGMNAIIMQVRPVADAFYPSKYEPWSEYLTGVQGKAPDPYYDPLQFMIEETHKRGMEFHAWLNPYRAVFHINKSSIAPNHITRVHPEWFITYGDKKYFDPGLPQVVDYVTNIVKDIIQRYEVDAIHMDDYFYPYRITGKEFPDNESYKRYGKGLSKDDWRRSNCDSIIKSIYETIVKVNPHVKFGISPFGVWRNKSQDPQGSNTKGGQTNYDDLYADILLWLKNGWIDYVAPQLYWEIGHKLCDYEILLKWWAERSYDKHVYVGHAAYRATEPAWRKPSEIPNEIKLLRKYNTVHGSAYFSCKSLLPNPHGWTDSLRNNYYHYPAIVPPMLWVDDSKPLKPLNVSMEEAKGKPYTPDFYIKGTIRQQEDDRIKSIVVYLSDDPSRLGKQPFYISSNFNGNQFSCTVLPSDIPAEWHDCYIAISALNRGNNESELSQVFKLVRSNTGWRLGK